jgi:hypothetical protein
MRQKPSFVKATVIAVLALGSVPVQPATAVGAENVQFDIDGKLPKFPCEDGCQAEFSGAGNGGGNIRFEISGVTYAATFTILGGVVNGVAEYSEPEDFPLCPLLAFASNRTTGSVNLTGGATGVIVRTSPVLPGGTTFEVSTTLLFTYTRAGATPAITIDGGSVTIDYFIPGYGTGSVTKALVNGAGTGVFEVDAGTAYNRCTGEPGELKFKLIGDAVVQAA